jgi:hypothetical protein
MCVLGRERECKRRDLPLSYSIGVYIISQTTYLKPLTHTWSSLFGKIRLHLTTLPFMSVPVPSPLHVSYALGVLVPWSPHLRSVLGLSNSRSSLPHFLLHPRSNATYARYAWISYGTAGSVPSLFTPCCPHG